MYELNKQEKTKIKLWIITVRIDYFRKNKYLFNEESIEEKLLYSKEDIEETVLNNLSNNLENIFTETNLAKAAKLLTYDEKLILSLYYIEERTDNDISKVLFLTRSAVTKKRKRAIEKLKQKYGEWGKDHV